MHMAHALFKNPKRGILSTFEVSKGQRPRFHSLPLARSVQEAVDGRPTA
jgi:hypothetical protein